MTRQCGDCQLCCKLLPVRELGKGSNEKCVHQRFKKGCAIYGAPEMPLSCRAWNCRWLLEDDTADLSRPDRSRYVIDVMPDYIEASDNETGEKFRINIIQIWVDGDAWSKDQSLRDYMMRRGAEGYATLIRYNSKDALPIFPPSLTGMDRWIAKPGTAEGQHSIADIMGLER
jgi:hypothetical protein